MKSTNANNAVPQKESRKPYHKPLIEQVRLVLDEAVLGSGCKIGNNDGPIGDTGPIPCSGIGDVCVLDGT